jgi:hypothetical protein
MTSLSLVDSNVSELDLSQGGECHDLLHEENSDAAGTRFEVDQATNFVIQENKCVFTERGKIFNMKDDNHTCENIDKENTEDPLQTPVPACSATNYVDSCIQTAPITAEARIDCKDDSARDIPGTADNPQDHISSVKPETAITPDIQDTDVAGPCCVLPDPPSCSFNATASSSTPVISYSDIPAPATTTITPLHIATHSHPHQQLLLPTIIIEDYTPYPALHDCYHDPVYLSFIAMKQNEQHGMGRYLWSYWKPNGQVMPKQPDGDAGAFKGLDIPGAVRDQDEDGEGSCCSEMSESGSEFSAVGSERSMECGIVFGIDSSDEAQEDSASDASESESECSDSESEDEYSDDSVDDDDDVQVVFG